MEGNTIMAVQDQEMGMMNIPLEPTPAAQGNTTHRDRWGLEENTTPTTTNGGGGTGSPAVSRSLPEFPPKGSDNRRCLEWSCGTIACAIITSVIVCIVLPVVLWAIIANSMVSNFNDTSAQMYHEFNDSANGLNTLNSGGFDSTGSFDPNQFFGTN